ncbi:MAG: hypoxanthine phosphoribosyltransferase [Calditrichaeota bacterium]|nr:hypoxanthine phosphoribosyltransferase [Calditrichota bacterium]
MADADPQEITVPASSRYGGQVLELFIPGEKIQSKVAEIAAVLSEQFRDRCPILIGVLNGSFMFMADLVRQLDIDFEIDFIKIASYGSETASTGTVRLLKDISADITGRDVVIVEDIVDTGLTVKFLRNRMEEAAPTSVMYVTLLLKYEVAKLDFPIDYVGFNIPNRFVVGYGLDVDQKLRGLRSLYAFREN